MEIQLLNEQQAEQIYRSYMVQDFPPSELKPFASVQGLMRRGLYEPLALYEDGALAAYAWLVVLPGCPGALLDYFAVLPERRGSGVGTRALQALAGHYAPSRQTLIIECEHPACAPDPAAARRRVGFYLRAGARPTAMESLLFGVRYQIYALPCGGAESDADIRADLETLYRTMVPEPYYRGNVVFFGS